MALPKLIDVVKIKKWKPEVKSTSCYMYNFKHLGVTPQQVADILVGKQAMLFEKPFSDKVGGKNCPWCDFKADKTGWHGRKLQDHIFTHPGKTILSYQLVKFQKEIYTLRLQMVRKGSHEAMPLFVEHMCQDCLNPVAKGRKNMCVYPVSPRSRMRSLRMLGYPIKHLIHNENRVHRWSALAVIVLMQNETSGELPWGDVV